MTCRILSFRRQKSRITTSLLTTLIYRYDVVSYDPNLEMPRKLVPSRTAKWKLCCVLELRLAVNLLFKKCCVMEGKSVAQEADKQRNRKI